MLNNLDSELASQTDSGNPFVPIQTLSAISDGTVTLDEFRQSDACTMLGADSDSEHRRRFGVPDSFIPSLEHSQRVMSRCLDEKAAGKSWAFAVRDSQTGELLAGCELRPRTSDTMSLSYWVYPMHRSRGVGSRAVTLVCTMVFERLGFKQIDLLIDTDNPHSQRIAVRNGFTHVGMRDGRVLFVKKSTRNK